MSQYFDYVISNPPYQLSTGVNDRGRENFIKIYDLFQKQAYYYANKSIMIYPAAWQNDITIGYGKWMMSHGLSRITNYNGGEVFGPAIMADYPIVVAQIDKNNDSPVMINDYEYPRNISIIIDSPVKRMLYDKTSHWRKMMPGVKHISRLKNISDSNHTFREFPEHDDDVRVYVKKNSGTQNDSGEYYLGVEDALELFGDYVGDHIVAVKSAYFKQARIIKNLVNTPGDTFGFQYFGDNYVFGNTWIMFSVMDSEEEAVNLCKYLNTRIISLLLSFKPTLSGFGEYVPDLGDYSDDNPVIDWSEDIEPQLYELFGLTEEDISLIN